MRALERLGDSRLMVGIPSDKADRTSDEPLNNAALMFIHEHGAPEANIPARPVIYPTIEASKDRIRMDLKKAGRLSLDGRHEAIEQAFNSLGIYLQSAMRAKITNGPFAPLAESTLRNRARKGSKGAKAELASRKQGNPPNPNNARPLVFTGQIRRALTYVIRRISNAKP